MKLPADLIQKLGEVHEEAGSWLETLDDLFRRLEARWDIRVTGLVEELSYHVVAFAEGADGAPYILKLGPPTPESLQEIAALSYYDGDGICRLLATDPEATAMLLERVQPGVSLWNSQDDDLATRACADLLLQLWCPVDDESAFRSLHSWTRALPEYLERHPKDGPLPHDITQKSTILLEELLQEDNEPVLLHGDLHHGNILTATHQPFLAIDPKGIVGARAFDVTAFLRNPEGITQRSDFGRVLDRRITVFSERLELSPREIARWSYVECALSSCWYFRETGKSAQSTQTMAAALERWL